MRQILLPHTSSAFSRLSFGCSGLMARLSRSDSLHLLQVAADNGITHFDVARSYGYGDAESVVGDLIETRPGALTVTTKVGILPPQRSRGLDTAKAVARRLAGLHPRLRQALRQRAASMVRHGAFDLATVQKSFETSLRTLRVERVDLLLLHDCTYDDLQPGLLEYLERCRDEGKVGQFGLATDQDTIRHAFVDRRAFVPIAQFATDPSAATAEQLSSLGDGITPGIITHSALGAQFSEVANRLASDQVLARRWTQRLQVDVADRNSLGQLFLAAALSRNPDGVVLFSSTRPDTIGSNAKLASQAPLSLDDRAALQQMIQEALEAVSQGIANDHGLGFASGW